MAMSFLDTKDRTVVGSINNVVAKYKSKRSKAYCFYPSVILLQMLVQTPKNDIYSVIFPIVAKLLTFLSLVICDTIQNKII